MTRGRAMGLAAAAAAMVYLPSLGNSFALDDGPVVQRNPAAHAVGPALHAFDQPYWPPENGAGQWRPLVILSFAVDWQLSGGSTVWLHAANVAWHAAATALLVPILAAYVPLAAALAGALVFAVHPVHVEAVANLVGRAEPIAACFLFAALLLGRVVRRRRAAGLGTLSAEIGLVAAVSLALLSKEHAALAVALLALDDFATRDRVEGLRALPWRDYAAVAVLTAAWFVMRRTVDAGASFRFVAPTFYGLGAWGRVSTMLPAAFVVLRLLVWPFDLSADYMPQIVPRLTGLTALGVAGLVVALAGLALAIAAWRGHRALSVGLLLVGLAWLPTSNLFFPTGVVVAERTLYLASAGAVLVLAAGYERLSESRGSLTAALAAGVVLLAFGLRSVTQVPVWRTNRDLVLWGLEHHPDSYRQHQAAARALVRMGDLPDALHEYDLAIELFPLDDYDLVEAASAALDRGEARRSLAYLRRIVPSEGGHVPDLVRTLTERAVRARDAAGSAARQARTEVPRSPMR